MFFVIYGLAFCFSANSSGIILRLFLPRRVAEFPELCFFVSFFHRVIKNFIPAICLFFPVVAIAGQDNCKLRSRPPLRDL